MQKGTANKEHCLVLFDIYNVATAKKVFELYFDVDIAFYTPYTTYNKLCAILK